MAVAAKFPLTYRELAEFAPGKEVVRFPATFDEYWELLKQAEYRADFYQNEIIAMSYEDDLFIDTRRPEVITWQRLDGQDKWLEETFSSPDSSFPLGQSTLTLQEIYQDSLS